MRKKLIYAINQLERIIYEPLFDQGYVDKNHAWDYVSYSFDHFLTHLKEAKKITSKRKVKFLDVGCGLGTKVCLASSFFDSYGIELNSKYYKVAKDVNTPRKFHTYGRYEDRKGADCIFKEDALNFDYNPYDVIYFFRPLSDEALQKQLEQRIFKTCRPGTIIIPIYSQSTFPSYIRHLPTPSKELYIKIKDDQRAQQVNIKVKRLFSGI